LNHKITNKEETVKIKDEGLKKEEEEGKSGLQGVAEENRTRGHLCISQSGNGRKTERRKPARESKTQTW
jgi:hypothetical protein